jgi:hypothetical protein
MTRSRTRASAVSSQRLTAWAMARPLLTCRTIIVSLTTSLNFLFAMKHKRHIISETKFCLYCIFQ